MKIFIILILIFLSLVSTGQVIKLRIYQIDEKFPIIDTLEPFQDQVLILNKENNSCLYHFDNGEYIIFLPKNENNEVVLKFCLSNIVLKLNNLPTIDTIILSPLFLVSNDLSIKDVWYKDDFRFYKQLYRKKIIEYSKDSTYYCKGYYKGKRLSKRDYYDFYFSENGKWETYNKNGQLIIQSNFKNGKLNGGYKIKMNEIGLSIKGQHKEGEMTGDWTYYYEKQQYVWTFIDNYIVYDFIKNNR